MTFGINWNYIQAKRQADRLQEQAERLRKLAQGDSKSDRKLERGKRESLYP